MTDTPFHSADATPDDLPVADAIAVDALDALELGVLCVAPDWRIRYVNAAWGAITGADVDDYRGADLWAAFPPLGGLPEAALIRATADDGVPRRYRTHYVDAQIDGSFDVQVRRSGAGGLVFAVSNVTAQQQRDEVHDRLLEGIGEGLIVVDADWRVTYVNAAAESVTGVRRNAALGRVIWDVFPTIRRTPVETMSLATMATRAPGAVRTVPFSRRVGGRRIALVDARSYAVAGGGLLVLFSEVTARERQARELAERSAENERLRELARAMAAIDDSAALLDALCDAAVDLCDAAGATVAMVLDDAEAVFVAARNHPPEVRGHRFPLAGTLTERLLAMQDDPHGRAMLLRVAADEAHDAAYRGDLADGRQVGAIVLAPLMAQGAALGVLAVSRAEGEPPFSERDEQRLRVVADHASLALWKARLVEEARTAVETRSAFLATVSHELRTPLTALTGYGELLADEILGPLTGDQCDVVERMRAVTHQLTAMIEEILTFSALEAGRELVRPVPFDVAEVVHAVTAVVEPIAEGKGLVFDAAVPPVPPPLVTDPDKLRQILVNLCGNAVKFTARGSVTLRVEPDEAIERVRFVVADTGVGIAADDLPRLFHAFTQLDTGLTRRFGGTGLGLYISQRLARLLGGRIEVASALGTGSVFTLTVPMHVHAPGEHAREHTREAPH